MSTANTAVVAEPDWQRLPARLGGTVLIIGRPGLGKTPLVGYLAEQLTAQGHSVGVLSTDMGQAAVGAPTCLALSLGSPWQRPTASWFIGDTTPVANLLPTVVGAAQLAHRARQQGVQILLVDTTGLVDGPLGCVLKYHKTVAIGVDHVVALQRESELELLLALLQKTCRSVHRLRPTPEARDRGASERKQYREARFLAHFQGGAVLALDSSKFLNLDWALGHGCGSTLPRRGTVMGLIDHDGFCPALGMLEAIRSHRLLMFTNWRNPDAVAWVQAGKVQLGQQCEELSR